MSFTIKCDKCGQEQKLEEDNFYDKDKISISVNPWVDSWEALEIKCQKCKQLI